MDIYDLNTKQWSAVQMPVAYTFARATGAGNKVVVTAGSRYSLSQFHSYDILTGQWASKTVPEARAEVTMLGVGTKVFFAGGSTSNGTVSNRIDIYDTATDQWTTATLSQARSSITTITVGTKTFFAGGNPTSNAVDIYDAMSNQWTTAMLSQGRSGIIATSAGTKVFFAGGEGSSIVDIYDTATGQWSTTQLPQARNDLAAVQAGERALFAESGPGTLGSNISGKVDIYTTNSALPVNLMSFSGRWIENIGTQLSWTTSWETHNDHFQIQRSSNAKNFETIGRVAGKGTTSERTDYSFTDIATPDPVNYYRLKQVDLDGSTHFSNIIAITRQPEPQATKLSVWPSPTTGTLTLELTGGKTIQQVGVYDLHGRKLTSQVGAQATADVSSLPTGAYVVEVLTTDGQQLRSRFVKQ
ncbi:Kelch repeat-containing protein [Spirosoma sp.]|uniref:Kelch repeat-containing protein n=1 Tax=Spirosoma sp. TaxID=1899569 RepID=UPI003B3AEAC8